jgi:hypothetical protein
VALRRFLASSHDQRDPADKHQSAQERRDRVGVLGVGGGLDGANVDNFLGACAAALISKSHDTEKDESDPKKRYRFAIHKSSSFLLKLKGLKESASVKEFDPEV